MKSLTNLLYDLFLIVFSGGISLAIWAGDGIGWLLSRGRRRTKYIDSDPNSTDVQSGI